MCKHAKAQKPISLLIKKKKKHTTHRNAIRNQNELNRKINNAQQYRATNKLEFQTVIIVNEKR